MNRNCRRKTEKVYVKVNSDFDATGSMQPRQITDVYKRQVLTLSGGEKIFGSVANAVQLFEPQLGVFLLICLLYTSRCV